MPEKTDRLFIALSVPDPVKIHLSLTIDEWKTCLSFHKWVHPDDYHVTLVFLGETSSDLSSAVIRSLRDMTSRRPAPQLSVERAGTFGDNRNPRVLWANVNEAGMNRLELLQSDISAAMEKLGFPVEKRTYRPHITLARKYTGKNPLERDMIEQIKFTPHIFPASEVALYRTHMNRTPMYEKLARFALS